jgi:hypothetical protein
MPVSVFPKGEFMSSFLSRREREVLLKYYEVTHEKWSVFQDRRFLAIGFIATLEVGCVTAFSFLVHTSPTTVFTKLFSIIGLVALPVLGLVLLGGLRLIEGRLKDYYIEAINFGALLEERLEMPGLFVRLTHVPKTTFLELDHTEYFRLFLIGVGLFWYTMLPLVLAQIIKMW